LRQLGFLVLPNFLSADGVAHVSTEMTSRQRCRSPGIATCTSPSDEASEPGGPPTSSVPSPGPPTSLKPAAAAGDGRPTSGSSPAVGTSCPGGAEDPPKLVALMAGDEDKAAAAAQRLQVHWTHGRKRRASGDSHEVSLRTPFIPCVINLCLFFGPGNGSPMATNVVLVLEVVVIRFSIP